MSPTCRPCGLVQVFLTTLAVAVEFGIRIIDTITVEDGIIDVIVDGYNKSWTILRKIELIVFNNIHIHIFDIIDVDCLDANLVHDQVVEHCSKQGFAI